MPERKPVVTLEHSASTAPAPRSTRAPLSMAQTTRSWSVGASTLRRGIWSVQLAAGLRDRLNRAPPQGCPGNEITDVLTTNEQGTVTVVEGCEQSARLIVIPVVDQIANPELSEILGFAILFLTGQSNQGGHLNLHAQFVTLVSPLVGGNYGGGGGNDSTAVVLSNSCSVCSHDDD